MKIKLRESDQYLVLESETAGDLFTLGRIVGKFPQARSYNSPGNASREVQIEIGDVVKHLAEN